MSEQGFYKLMIENVKKRGEFYTLHLDVEEYDSFWEWKRANYKPKKR